MTNPCGFTEPWIQQIGSEDNHFRVRTLARLPIIVLVLTLCAFWLGCGGSDPKPTNARGNTGQPMPVTVSMAERRDMPYYLTGLGSVTAYYTVSVKSRVDGQLVDVK